MRTSTFAALVFTTAVALCARDKVQPLSVKVGLWEVTTTVEKSSPMLIPADVVARLTPEERARVEERMKARSGERTTATTRKQCLTREELEKGATFGQHQESCTRTVLFSTPVKVEVRIECDNRGVKSDGTLQVVALDLENVKGSVHFVLTGAHPTMGSRSTFIAKWIGPVCRIAKENNRTCGWNVHAVLRCAWMPNRDSDLPEHFSSSIATSS